MNVQLTAMTSRIFVILLSLYFKQTTAFYVTEEICPNLTGLKMPYENPLYAKNWYLAASYPISQQEGILNENEVCVIVVFHQVLHDPQTIMYRRSYTQIDKNHFNKGKPSIATLTYTGDLSYELLFFPEDKFKMSGKIDMRFLKIDFDFLIMWGCQINKDKNYKQFLWIFVSKTKKDNVTFTHLISALPNEIDTNHLLEYNSVNCNKIQEQYDVHENSLTAFIRNKVNSMSFVLVAFGVFEMLLVFIVCRLFQ